MNTKIFKPHNYQRDAIDFLLENNFSGLFADPGLGKTAITLSVIERIRRGSEFRGALIIAPLRVAEIVWPAEIKKWGRFKGLTYQVLHGPGKYRSLFKPADIYLINVENFFWLFDVETQKWLKSMGHSLPFNMLVIDESSKFKSSKAKRVHLLKRNLNQFYRRIILTGTPASNSLLDLFTQAYMVDRGATFSKYISHYQNRYFYAVMQTHGRKRGGQKQAHIDWVLKPGADKVIYLKLSKIVKRIDAKDHLDLPPIVYNKISVQLPPRAEQIYKQLEKQFFAEIDEVPVLLGSAASKYNACRQVANGCLYEPIPMLTLRAQLGKRKTLRLHSAKISATQEIVDELQGKPVLIAYHFKHDLEQLLDHFGAVTPYLGGGVSASKSAKIVNSWNAGKIPMLLGHPQSIAHGLNLQHGGHDIIWFSLTDNLESYLQFNDRIHRQGVTEQVRIHLIIAANTIDLAVMAQLERKETNQRILLDAIKEYRNDYN
jgi:SNF2 family DNA or RNA helicase